MYVHCIYVYMCMCVLCVLCYVCYMLCVLYVCVRVYIYVCMCYLYVCAMCICWLHVCIWHTDWIWLLVYNSLSSDPVFIPSKLCDHSNITCLLTISHAVSTSPLVWARYLFIHTKGRFFLTWAMTTRDYLICLNCPLLLSSWGLLIVGPDSLADKGI